MYIKFLIKINKFTICFLNFYKNLIVNFINLFKKFIINVQMSENRYIVLDK